MTDSSGICVQSFRRAYQNSRSLNFTFLVYRVVETLAGCSFIITLTSLSLYKIAQRPAIVTMARINRDRYVSVTMLVISSCFVCCYSPFALYISFTIFPEIVSREAELVVGQTVLTLLELTSLTNPSIYLARNIRVKRQCAALVRAHVQAFSKRLYSLRNRNTTTTTQDTNCVVLDNRSVEDSPAVRSAEESPGLGSVSESAEVRSAGEVAGLNGLDVTVEGQCDNLIEGEAGERNYSSGRQLLVITG